MLKQLILIFVGGGIGSILRHMLHHLITKNNVFNFPFGTLAVNIIGSFIIGFSYALWIKSIVDNDIRILLAVGFCGGFTTFSTFSFDSVILLKNGNIMTFILYAFTSIFLCIIFLLLGDFIGKSITN